MLCQRKQVGPLDPVQPKRPTQSFQKIGRNLNVSALLEPPGEPHTCELRDLLAAQSRRAAAGTGRQVHILWARPRAEVCHESGQRSTFVGAGEFRLR